MGILKVISVSGDSLNEYTIDTLDVEKKDRRIRAFRARSGIGCARRPDVLH